MKLYSVSVLSLACLLPAFIASSLAQFDPNCVSNRRTIVQLFEWRWDDIALECERFLSTKGFCGVQVSPPNEHRVVMMNDGVVKRPWWERYQPVSYKIYTRSGDEKAFIDMVQRCNNVGVRIYVDAVFNNMAGGDADDVGTAGSKFNSQTLDFPDVNYTKVAFHQKGVDCKTESGSIEDFNDADQVRKCRVNNLPDLDQNKVQVRQTIAAYLNKLIEWGVAGFRIDSAKNMLPFDLRVLTSMLQALPTKWFTTGSTAFIYQDVADFGHDNVKSVDYYNIIGRVTEFNYGKYLSEMFSGRNQLKHLKNFGSPGWGYLMPDDKALVFIDDQANQRGHGSGGNVLTFFNAKQYKMATAFMLAWPYGQAKVMSSYRWDRKFQGGRDLNDWVGPPSDDNLNIKAVTISGDGLSCGNGWVCEHRWRAIANMALLRNVAGDEKVASWWDDGDNQVAFSRGRKAFFAVNAGRKTMSVTLQTGLPAGRYCDVISGERTPDCRSCTGKAFTVSEDGNTQILIASTANEPMVALHLDSRLGECPPPEQDNSSPASPTVVSTTSVADSSTSTPSTWKRTVVFMYFATAIGEDLFLNGGLDVSRNPNCKTTEPKKCMIPIRYDHVTYKGSHYEPYNAWSEGDNFLNWFGAEDGQGEYNSLPAGGSPMVWTTNRPITDTGYNALNTYGEEHWMWDVMMDCSATQDGWFEFNANVNDAWGEIKIKQDEECIGTGKDEGTVKAPFTSRYHIAKCGFTNVFSFNNGTCVIDRLL